MSITDRPFSGTWKPNLRQTIKTVPDALIYVNGDVAIPGCPTCNGKIDLQDYITDVSVDPSVEGPATATFSLHIPHHMGDSLVRDGNFVLHTGLEVHIYFRGYFPTTGILSDMAPEFTGGVDLQDTVMYPYYLSFHGVMTDVNYEYSGGLHTASISCTDLLHFWQYHMMADNAAALAAKPSGSKVFMSLIGHNFTGLSPYAIIYTLFRDVAGAAGGVSFALGNETNATATSTVTGESLFSLNVLYWAQRFAQSMTALRMYGASGELYNTMQAAFLGTTPSSVASILGGKSASADAQRTEFDVLAQAGAAKVLGIEGTTVSGAATDDATDPDGGSLSVDVAGLQAFVSDIGSWGQVEFFETPYTSKMDIAVAVKEASGFEFYMDVDGDIVFKPPFYNLDTSSSRVYCIEPIDVVSFSSREGEPECTHISATGGHFQNQTVGSGLEAEWGNRAEFIDYRLVAQYGWRKKNFASSYHVGRRALFFACIAKMDIFNIAVKSASCTIPLRPELRPGYPVYIAHLDCFYYLTSMSHSFTYGGSCTTTLNLVGKRAKFYAPGKPTGDGNPAEVGDIDLSNMHLPQLPLELRESGQVPRLVGFPNVVMTLDPTMANPLTFYRGVTEDALTTEDSARSLIRMVLMGRTGILEVDSDAAPPGADAKSLYFDGPWRLKATNDTYTPVTVSSVTAAATARQTALEAAGVSSGTDAATKQTVVDPQDAQQAMLSALILAAQTGTEKANPGSDSTGNYLELLTDYKATYAPGKSIPGYYRYYSSSHPTPEQQGPQKLTTDTVTGLPVPADHFIVGPVDTTKPIKQFGTGNNLVDMAPNSVLYGIPILVPGSEEVEPTPTHLITTFQVAAFGLTHPITKVTTGSVTPTGSPKATLAEAYATYFESMFSQATMTSETLLSNFKVVYETYAESVRKIVTLTEPPSNIKGGGDNTSFLANLRAACPGITIRQTDGTRTAHDQAAAMLALYNKGQDLIAMYANDRLVQQILDAPITDVAATTAVIQDQIDSGDYISDHLKGDAVDVSINDLTSTEQDAVCRAANDLGAQADVHGDPLHIHIEDIPDTTFASPLVVDGTYELGNFKFPLSTTTNVVPSVFAIPEATPFGAVVAEPESAASTSVVALPTSGDTSGVTVSTLGDLAGDDVAGQLHTLATTLGASLATAVDVTLSALKNGVFETKTVTLTGGTSLEGDARIAWEHRVFDAAYAAAYPPGSHVYAASQGTALHTEAKEIDNAHMAPVFPVSDAHGYEVVGTYRYGRGLSIEDGGGFQQLRANKLGTNADFALIEAFYQTVTTEGGLGVAVARASVATRAALAASVGGTDIKVEGGSMLVLKPGGTWEQMGYGARPAGTNQSTQKLTVTNAAYSLADMAVTNGKSVCTCKGSMASEMLLAFAGTAEFVPVETEQVNTWLQEQAQLASVPWAANQQALRGTVVTPPPQQSEDV